MSSCYSGRDSVVLVLLLLCSKRSSCKRCRGHIMLDWRHCSGNIIVFNQSTVRHEFRLRTWCCLRLSVCCLSRKWPALRMGYGSWKVLSAAIFRVSELCTSIIISKCLSDVHVLVHSLKSLTRTVKKLSPSDPSMLMRVANSVSSALPLLLAALTPVLLASQTPPPHLDCLWSPQVSQSAIESSWASGAHMDVDSQNFWCLVPDASTVGIGGSSVVSRYQ